MAAPARHTEDGGRLEQAAPSSNPPSASPTEKRLLLNPEDNALQTLEELGYSIWVTAKKADGDERRIVADRKPSLILRRIQQPRKEKGIHASS
jgi:hypothetical protein